MQAAAGAAVWRSAFIRNVATLASGQGLAMAIPILAAPVLGRLYRPDDYGLLGAYMGLAGVFSMIGNWQYAQAVVVQRTEKKARSLIAVSIWASLVSAVVALAIVACISGLVDERSSLRILSPWIWIVPVTTLLSGVTGALAAAANRRRKYRLIASVAVASQIVSSTLSIAMGYMGAGVSGLLISYIAGQAIPFAVYMTRFPNELRAITRTSVAGVLANARSAASFPFFSLPASMLRALAFALPSFSLVYLGATDLAGHFARAQSLLALPIGMIGMAIAQVFQEKVVRDRALNGDCWKSYKTLLVVLAVASPIGFALLALAAPDLFVLYLGAHWKDTGAIAQLLAPMMCLRMIAGPLFPIFAIFNANNYDLRYSIWQFGWSVLLAVALAVLAFPPIYQIVSFVVVNSFVNIAHILQTCLIVRRDHQQNVLERMHAQSN